MKKSNVNKTKIVVATALFQHRNAGSCYRIFSEEFLPELIQDVPVAIRKQLRFQYDGLPGHFSNVVYNYLNPTVVHSVLGLHI